MKTRSILKDEEMPLLGHVGRLVCACGALQRSVAYSEHYKGLVFGCDKTHERRRGEVGSTAGYVCRSQDEGSYPTVDNAYRALGFYAHTYGLEVLQNPASTSALVRRRNQ
jgi:hypothetical protein